MTWQPVPDSEVTRGLAAMIVFNGLHEYADCRLCRQVPDVASVPMLALARLLDMCKAHNDVSGRFGYEIVQVERWLDKLKGGE